MIRFEPMASKDVARHLAASVQRRALGATHALVGPILYQETRLGVLALLWQFEGEPMGTLMRPPVTARAGVMLWWSRLQLGSWT